MKDLYRIIRATRRFIKYDNYADNGRAWKSIKERESSI